MLNRLAGPTSKADKLMKVWSTNKDASGNMLNIVDIMAQVAKQTERWATLTSWPRTKRSLAKRRSGMAELHPAKPGPAASPNMPP